MAETPWGPFSPFLSGPARRAYSFNLSDHFMAGNARVSYSRKTTFDRKGIGVTNATGLDNGS